MSDTDRMTAHDVAAHLGCGYRKALRLMGNEIPAVLDYRWTARRADVEAFLDARTEVNRHTKKRSRGRGRRT